MSVERIITKIPTEAEIEQASPNEIGKISWAVVCDLLGGTITTNGATENINIIPSANRLFFRLKN